MDNHAIPFCEVLKEAMDYTEHNNKSLERLLLEYGVEKINFRRISDYINGQYTPPYTKAKQILDVLGYSMSESELIDSLNANKKYIREINDYKKEKKSEYQTSIRLRLKNILPGREPEYVQFMLENRIVELYGNEGKLSIYIQDLIAADLQRFILEREDINND